MGKQVKTWQEALSVVQDGMTVMIGGFLAVGTPEGLIDELLESGVRDLVVIGNDTGFIDKGIGRLVAAGRCREVIVSHVGTNPETGKQMHSGELKVTLVPQGTLAEQIRAGGAGLGGILTPTGIGTVVAEGKQVIEVGGKEYLLELPLRADVALIKAHQADEKGNLVYRRSARNFNPLMAKAAEVVIAEVDEIVPVGSLDPDAVVTPGLLVDVLVTGGAVHG
ncbi:MAG TPA: acetate CoA-transferase subunit alpha [Firmicutes bacterium]|nr:acetate CoA-transferase subunit alpha [Bacillota bacterium]